ncbi:MAG: ATP-binding protein [Pseudomonadota bacterium]
MLKKILIAMIAMLVVVLLYILVRESRSVSGEFYIDYSNYVSTLRQSQRDYETLSDTLSVVSRQVQTVPETVDSLTARLGQSANALRAPSLTLRNATVSREARTYTNKVEQLLIETATFAEAQVLLAAAADSVRVDGPQVVRALRDGGEETLSQALFGFSVEVLDVAAGQSEVSPDELQRRVDELAASANETNNLPEGFADLIAASGVILSQSPDTAAALESIAAIDLPATSQALYRAVAANNASITSKADRARLLLAAVSILLILCIAWIGVRLQQSNATLAETNLELEQFNVSLEERVSERTRELSSAYSELQESQAQLVQAEKMSSLGELVAGISHEINTPLWYLLSNTTLIKERLGSFNRFVDVTHDMLELLRAGGGDKDAFVKQLRRLDHALNNDGLRDDLKESNDLLDDSVEGLEQLSEMAQSLKDFSRLDRAATDSVNLNDGIEKTLVISKNVLKGGIEIRKNLGDLPPVSCSPSQINQVLLNLIKNAADAMDKKGVLTLTTWADDNNAYISVQDTGEGMDEETLAKVRDPFFTTKEVGKGTGLGLSISQKIIDTHNGRLDIKSAPGAGSTFTIVLPTGDEPEQSDMARELAELEQFSKDLENGEFDDSAAIGTDLDFPTEKTA